MKRLLTAALLVPVVVWIVFRGPLWLFAMTVAAVIVVSLREYLVIVEASGIKPFHSLTYALGLAPAFVLLRASAFADPSPAMPHTRDAALVRTSSILLLAPVLFGLLLVFRKDLRGGLASIAASIFGVLYIAVSLSTLIVLRADPGQSILVVFVLVSVWAGDIAAYYVGRAAGKHKLAPAVSPNKSWEGAIASVVASLAVAFVFFLHGQPIQHYIVPSTDVWNLSATGGWIGSRGKTIHVIALGLVTNVAAQFGDLFESALKRGAGVKDSGALLPGHGGMLDRVDALLFAVPAVWYYAQVTGFPATS